MRLGVLDIGSNAANLRVVEARPGSSPRPVLRHKAPTGLADATRTDGVVPASGVRRLVDAVSATVEAARRERAAELIPYATAAVRDAANRDEIVAALRAEAGIDVGFLSGVEEARLTYFAAHRWYGWSSGPLLLLDIGGGSMEVAHGHDEEPELAVSLPLGACRLTRSHLPDHPATRRQVKRLRKHVREVLAPTAARLRRVDHAGRIAATSKTFKQLARFAGRTDPASASRLLYRRDLRAWIPRLAAMTPHERAELPGVRPARARQLLAGAVVASAAMAALGLDRVEVCPWALREGVLLRRLDSLPPRGTLPAALPRVPLVDADVSDLTEYRATRAHPLRRHA
jgi:exopolyphosphatase/guanosine-5'-triphosphate,3'-diphosphate pyrophosphatase